ncbi:hypothetical protein Droror1_Dr00008863 [Drosera rotundifolia]
MSFAVAFVHSALIMAGVILNSNAGRHEINFVLLQVHDVLLIFALVSGMPLMFRPIKDEFWMLIVVWFIYFVIVAVAYCQKILSVITFARDRLYSEEVKSVMNLAKGVLICRGSERSLPQHSTESGQTNNGTAAVVCNGGIEVRDIAYDDCYICTMSSAVAFVLSALIMAGVILNTNAGRHEINFVLIQVHYILRSSHSSRHALDVSTHKRQGSIAGKDTIFVPVHVRSNHFVLFVFYVKRWALILLDPMFDDTPSMSHSDSYKEEIAILGEYFAHMLRSYAPNMTFKKGPASFHTYQKRPKQRNGSDCGVYVLKYMDYVLRGISLENQEWSADDALIFRYRIALEILKRKARP